MAKFRDVCDLPEVIAKMLDSVVDGMEAADLEALDWDPIEQRILAKIRQHPIDFTGRFFHSRRKLGFAHGSSGCEFRGAVPAVQRSTSPTDNPLAKVTRHVQHEVPNAVAGLVGAPPDVVFGEDFEEPADLWHVVL